MDIAALSIVMSQSRVQESAGISVMKMAMDTGKETDTQMTEMMKNVAADTNIGQNLDTRAYPLWIYLFNCWSSIPDKIPSHFGAQGEVDSWGSKSILLMLPIFLVTIFLTIAYYIKK